jgi:hypothetical protein
LQSGLFMIQLIYWLILRIKKVKFMAVNILKGGKLWKEKGCLNFYYLISSF